MPAAGMARTWLRAIHRPSYPLGDQNAPLSSATHTVRTQCHFVIWMTEMDLKRLSCPVPSCSLLGYRKSEIICNNTSICGLCCKLKVWNDSSLKKTTTNNNKTPNKTQKASLQTTLWLSSFACIHLLLHWLSDNYIYTPPPSSLWGVLTWISKTLILHTKDNKKEKVTFCYGKLSKHLLAVLSPAFTAANYLHSQ